MPRLVLLGTGAAVPGPDRDNVYMVLQGQETSVLIDCGGSPIQKLWRAGVPVDNLDHVVATHLHPDHIYGLPILIMDLWLLGRERPLYVYGLAETLATVRGVMEAFRWAEWPISYAVEFHEVPARGETVLLEASDFLIVVRLANHSVPSLAVRMVSRATGQSVVYSSDTEPCEAVVSLARGADILLHEATLPHGHHYGHSSGRGAGRVARRAGVGRLVLVHVPPSTDEVRLIRREAEAAFGGEVEVGEDFGVYEL